MEVIRWLELKCNVKLLSPGYVHIEGFVEDCSTSIANTLEILQYCSKPLIYWTQPVPADVLSPNVHHQTHCWIQSKAYCLYFISNLCYIRTDKTPCKMLNWIWWDTAIFLEFRVHWCALYPGVSTDLSTAGQQINGKQTTEFSWLSPVFI